MPAVCEQFIGLTNDYAQMNDTMIYGYIATFAGKSFKVLCFANLDFMIKSWEAIWEWFTNKLNSVPDNPSRYCNIRHQANFEEYERYYD